MEVIVSATPGLQRLIITGHLESAGGVSTSLVVRARHRNSDGAWQPWALVGTFFSLGTFAVCIPGEEVCFNYSGPGKMEARLEPVPPADKGASLEARVKTLEARLSEAA